MVADLDWRAVLEGLELGQGYFARHKGADAGGDEHRGRQPRLNVVWPVVLPIAAHQPAPVGLALHAAHELAQIQRRVEGAQLLQQALGELAAAAHGQAGQVVDRFVGVERGALAAGFGQHIDQVAAYLLQPELKGQK